MADPNRDINVIIHQDSDTSSTTTQSDTERQIFAQRLEEEIKALKK
jgi:hypothetical protein